MLRSSVAEPPVPNGFASRPPPGSAPIAESDRTLEDQRDDQQAADAADERGGREPEVVVLEDGEGVHRGGVGEERNGEDDRHPEVAVASRHADGRAARPLVKPEPRAPDGPLDGVGLPDRDADPEGDHAAERLSEAGDEHDQPKPGGLAEPEVERRDEHELARQRQHREPEDERVDEDDRQPRPAGRGRDKLLERFDPRVPVHGEHGGGRNGRPMHAGEVTGRTV